MLEYKPTMSFPGEWLPRYLLGHYSVPMETPRNLPEPERVIPDHVRIQRIPYGVPTSDPAQELRASPPRTAATSKHQQSPSGPLSKSQAAILDHLASSHTARTTSEIADGVGMTKRQARACLRSLLRRAAIKHRRFSLPRRRGHLAQYVLVNLDWPPYPAGARVLRGQE